MADVEAGRFGVGSVVHRAFGVLRRNIVPFGLVALVFSIPGVVLTLVFGEMESAGGRESSVPDLVNMLFFLLLNAALVYGTFEDLGGQRATIGEIFSRGMASIASVLGLAAIEWIGAIVVILALAFLLPGAVALVLIAVFSALVFTLLWLAIPVAVVERPGVFASLRRSVELSKGERWRIFAILVVWVLILVGIALFVVAIGAGLMSIVGPAGVLLLVIPVWLVSMLMSMLFAVLSAVAYYDLRVFKEGVDVDQLAAVFD